MPADVLLMVTLGSCTSENRLDEVKENQTYDLEQLDRAFRKAFPPSILHAREKRAEHLVILRPCDADMSPGMLDLSRCPGKNSWPTLNPYFDSYGACLGGQFA